MALRTPCSPSSRFTIKFLKPQQNNRYERVCFEQKTLRRAGITPEKARLIRKVWLESLAGERLEPLLAMCPRTRLWYGQCHHAPKDRHIKREAINEIAEMHGVELLGIHKRSGEYLEYCNAGDTYTTTILFRGHRLMVGCWGDYVERGTVETDSEKIQRSFYS